MKIKYRAHNNFDEKANSDECSTTITEPSLTVQSMTDEADINKIMERYTRTGEMPQTARPIFYGDFDEIVDFRSALDALNRAQEAFDELPPLVRQRFMNDPQQYLEFCSNPDNKAEMHKLGLLRPDYQPPREPIETPPATGVATPPQGGS